MPDASGHPSGYDQAFVAEFYDHVVPYKSRADIAFFVEEATRSGGPVLELGCGTGRILLPTARAGVACVGLEVSEAMLQRCREAAAAEPAEVRARVELRAADMVSFDLERTFPLVTIPFRAFQHLETTAAQLDCLAACRRHVAPGGRLLLDLFNPSLELLVDPSAREERGEEPAFRLADGREVVRSMRNTVVDRARQLIGCELIHRVKHPDGRTERLVHAFRLRYLFRHEVEHLLARCGFRVTEVWSGHDRAPFGARYPGELLVAAEPA